MLKCVSVLHVRDCANNMQDRYRFHGHQHLVQQQLLPPHQLPLHLLHLMTLLHSHHSQMCCLEYHTAE